jgi:predicted Ser/Thr protein kinase/dipeptidyl aminopeptidase/acylaminoacyl peptidase
MSTPPAQIGPYRVEREIGRGGMGVVFLARDPRLERDVAIKALPDHLAGDPERLARFEREARTLAQLSHPNVAGIFGVEEHEGARYLVLEYVDGETLADRLDRGALPTDEAIELGIEIARGLEAAHEAGVVHRDLKPANIKLTPDGRVKVLDFGLAKSSDVSRSSSALTQSPTLTTPFADSPTVAGAIMGTAPYMSPEQARGRSVDKRTDLWSLGVVLYECLTGAGPFVGETATDSIGAILHRDVDFTRLPRDAPEALRRVLRRCLERDKDRRLRDAADARLDLEEARSGPRDRAPAAPRRRGRRVAAIAAALLVGALGVVAGWAARGPSDPGPEPTTHVSVPVALAPDAILPTAGMFDLSPDGRTIAYIGVDPNDDSPSPTPAIYLRSLGEREPRRLAGTDHAQKAFFSPDGSQLLFSWNDPDSPTDELRRVSVAGGPALTVLEDREGLAWMLGDSFGWLDGSTALVMGRDRPVLHALSIGGGAPREIATLGDDGVARARVVLRPRGMAGGAWILLTLEEYGETERTQRLVAVDPATGESSVILEDAAYGMTTAGGRLLFARGSTLCAAPFDERARQVTGAITPVASGLWGKGEFRVTAGGELLYALGPVGAPLRRIMTIDRSGNVAPLIELSRRFLGHVALSPDGKRLATGIASAGGNLPPRAHVVDLTTGFVRPVVDRPIPTFVPRWMPDGRVTYTEWVNVDLAVLKAIDPGNEAEGVPLHVEADGEAEIALATFTPDGERFVAAARFSDDPDDEGLFLFETDGARPPRRIAAVGQDFALASLSPDGRWLAYSTDASGRPQVVVRALDAEAPDRTPIVPVSIDGGIKPFWSPDGTELFFSDPLDKDIMGVRFEEGPTPTVSRPIEIIDGDRMDRAEGWGSPVAITPDGERFIFVEGADDGAPTALQLAIDWLPELDRLVPPAN